MKYLQKTLIIILVSTLGILFSVSNSWAPIVVSESKNGKICKKVTYSALINGSRVKFWIKSHDYINVQNKLFINGIDCKANDIENFLKEKIITNFEYNKHIDFIYFSDSKLCDYATYDKTLNWNENLPKYINAAKRRGLNCPFGNSQAIANNVKEFEKQLGFENNINELREQLELERADIRDKSDELERLEVLKLMDELELKEKNAEIQKDKLLDLERKLLALENKQKQELQKIDADTTAPVLEIISNKTKDKRGTINGYVSDNIKIAELSVDGKSIFFAPDGNFTFSIYVPPTGKKLKIQVTDMAGLTTLKNVVLKADRALADTSITFDSLNPLGKKVKPNPNALALIVGISSYENTKAKAIYADKDALVFKDYASEKLGISENRIKLLLNEEADFGDVLLTARNWLRRSAKQNQSDIYIFFAGHGLASQDGKNMYLLPFDGRPELLDKTALLRVELFSEIKKAKPKSVTVFLDTCYSGGARNEEMLIAGRPIVIRAKEQSIPNDFTLFSAASNEQISKPLEEAKHGMFSYFLMKAMEGDADTNADNKITARELHAYVEQNVVQQSSGSQTPELQGDKDRVLVQFN